MIQTLNFLKNQQIKEVTYPMFFKDLNDIIHKNFINLSLQINKYLDKISCNVNLDKYKNIEEVIELNVIYKKVNKLLKLFNKKDITNNSINSIILILFLKYLFTPYDTLIITVNKPNCSVDLIILKKCII